MKFYVQGKTLYEKGEYHQAGLQLRNAAHIDPKFTKAFLLLGMAELRQGDAVAAYAAFARAAELDPANLDAQVQLGRLLLLNGERDKAREKAKLVLKVQPRHEEGLLLQGALDLAALRPAETVRMMTQMVERGVTRSEVYLLLAMAQHAAQRDAKAECALLQGTRFNPHELPLYQALAELYAGQGQTAKAEAQIRQMIALDPTRHGYTLILAGLYWQSNDRNTARAQLDALLRASRNKEEVFLDTAAFYHQREQLPEAEQVLQQGLAWNKRSLRLRIALGNFFFDTGRHEQALPILKECLTLQRDKAAPEIIAAKNALAAVQLARGEWAEAERIVDEVLRETPRNRAANLVKGRLSLLQGEGARAVNVFNTVISASPEDVQAHLLLAEAHLLNRNHAAALNALRQAQKLAPRSLRVQLALAHCYACSSELGKAERVLRLALARNPGAPQLWCSLGDLLAAHRPREAERCYLVASRQTAAGVVRGRMMSAELRPAGSHPRRAACALSRPLQAALHDEHHFSRLVQLYLEQHNYYQAEAICRTRIKRNPGELLGYLKMLRALAEQGAFVKAQRVLLQAKAKTGPSVALSLGEAELHVRAGNLAKAREVLELILASHPDSPAAANEVASLLTECGGRSDLEKAMRIAGSMLKRRPGDPVLMDTLGWVYYRRGDNLEACQLLQRAAQRLQENPIVRYHAGMALLKGGEKSVAREHLQSAARCGSAFCGKEVVVATLKTLK